MQANFQRRTLFLFIETIFLDFSRYSCERKQLFPASGNRVFIKSFIATTACRFWVNFKPCAFIWSFFFCCCKALLKLGVNQFSSISSVANSRSSFSGQWKRIFYRILFISTSGNVSFSSVLLFRADFVLVETIIQIKVQSNLCPTIANHFLFVFIYICLILYIFSILYIFLPVKAAFRRRENEFC